MAKWVSRARFLVTFSLVALALSACPEEETTRGNPTGAVCDLEVNYIADIMPLIATYCLDCHASGLSPTARHGAPADHNLDSEIALLQVADHVVDYAGAGPAGSNTAMPPSNWPAPTLAERHMLAAYLACFADGGVRPHTHDGGTDGGAD